MDSEDRDHFQKLATEKPKVKTIGYGEFLAMQKAKKSPRPIGAFEMGGYLGPRDPDFP